jgi:hypothetical protein
VACNSAIKDSESRTDKRRPRLVDDLFVTMSGMLSDIWRSRQRTRKRRAVMFGKEPRDQRLAVWYCLIRALLLDSRKRFPSSPQAEPRAKKAPAEAGAKGGYNNTEG